MSSSVGSKKLSGSSSGESRLKITETIMLSSEGSSFEVISPSSTVLVTDSGVGKGSGMRIEEEEKNL